MPSRKKRRLRLVLAAGTGNAVGAGAGFLALACGMDPAGATIIGTVAGGSTAEVMLQIVGKEPVEHPHELVAVEEHPVLAPEPRRMPLPAPRRSYGRCGTVPATSIRTHRPKPGSPQAAAPVPSHPRHRHLHRGAVRFTQRAHARPRTPEACDGTS
ncbi:hypothetical protein AB0957_34740 [Streptomyces zhihengii]|uniref:hypothetical protein n=1 Tax=Streptomyces zhihengii TaxID=1818004 RepID=UPI0034555982